MNATTELTESFGISYTGVLLQVITLLLMSWILVGWPLMITRSWARKFQGDYRLTFWLLVIWLLPVVGPLIAHSIAGNFLTRRAE